MQMKKAVLLLWILQVTVSINVIAQRTINVDYNKISGKLNSMFNECVGAGRANEGLRADWQQQLAYVKKECGFKYIRMHGLLTDDMAVYKAVSYTHLRAH